jgi:GDP/UDP-N,N'-diacetylbacillosamine 2-epimerase (hydrolysing)
MTRRICYISGTRADFGLMRSTLKAIDAGAGMQLTVLATGMHLDPVYGLTVKEIKAAGLRLLATVPVSSGEPTGAKMARDIGLMIAGFTDALERDRPDLVLLLGDRGEMLAGAIAASHLNIPVAHVAGGERSGTIDEPVRHAVSKLSHIHLVSTDASKTRLTRMGERPDTVFVFGAPGLDDMLGTELYAADETRLELGLGAGERFLLFIFHPVLQEAERAGTDCQTILDGLGNYSGRIVALAPNSDAGSRAVLDRLRSAEGNSRLVLHTHLRRDLYLAALAHCAALIGNSSSGIIEAASFGVPVINVGPRQMLRERNANVADVGFDAVAIARAVEDALAVGRYPTTNIYGDGKSGQRIAELLRSIDLGPDLLCKINAY